MVSAPSVTVNVFNEREAIAAYKQSIGNRYRSIFPLSDNPDRGLTYNELHQLFPDASKSYQLSEANTFIERIRRTDPHIPFADAVRKAVDETPGEELQALPRSMKADLLTVMDISPASSPDYKRDLELRTKLQNTMQHGYFTPETFDKEIGIATKIKESVNKNEKLKEGLQHFDSLSLDQKKEVIAVYTDVISHAYGIPSPQIRYMDSYQGLEGQNSSTTAQQHRNRPHLFGGGGLLIHDGGSNISLRLDQLSLNDVIISVPHEVEHAFQDQVMREQILHPALVTPDNIQARLLVASFNPLFSRDNDNSNYINFSEDENGYSGNPNEMYSYRASVIAVQGVLAGIGNDGLMQNMNSANRGINETLRRLKFDEQEKDKEMKDRKELTAFLKENGDKEVNFESLKETAVTYRNNINAYQEMTEAEKKGVQGMRQYLVQHHYPIRNNDPSYTFQSIKKEEIVFISEQWQGGNKADNMNLVQEAAFHHIDLGNLPGPDQVLGKQQPDKSPQQR